MWPVAVEERDRRGGAGAVERGVLVDELGDPVVRAVQGVADQPEQVGLGGGLSGRRLLQLAELRDRRAGRDVTARRDNPAAIELYGSRGFERTGVRRDYYGTGQDAVLMRRRRPAPVEHPA